ncbi:hypothetical protein FRACYDRAFT_251280 [Fragilariopsis cylindrus CCMP1102]|uniref:Uncharacterized protein n=1 Tax=Fragilariopsis cylindrus CCMP1102 TaxID=635003 RepID=A0A1E7EMS7_9STRA|nr:hypothetical protein FRACYDRAFT_251280 [Fragilariopsis cylindrus CCMP1102]|eukprot:OEU07238.1 hypothetical protein FRACYDRAFT_251280 [Fragilariopsis cylindrus CCMP1102]
MTGFYDLTKMNIMSKTFTQIAELNRLQQSYPNNGNKLLHRMLIVEAIVTTTKNNKNNNKSKSASEIVGFCDVDCRPSNIQLKIKLPRPYISDLTINNHHRRQGLAKLLVQESEQFVIDRYNNKKKENGVDVVDDDIDIWIRVEENNIAALKLYQNALGYKITNWSTSTGTSTYKEEEEEKENDSVKSVSSNTTEDATTKIKIWTLRKILRK